MLSKIKSKVESMLPAYLAKAEKRFNLNRISPLLSEYINEFVMRPGKRVRPILFLAGYFGYRNGKPAKGLYETALSFELIHDFLLVHDDIIDKSDMRRGKPSMHAMFDMRLRTLKNPKFDGKDLSIVAGDVMYAMAIHSFLAIEALPDLKQKALLKLIDSAVYTGGGEFMELLSGADDIEDITPEKIYDIYDYKTAHYTFCCPLSAGAILAGASQEEINKLCMYGIYLGRAFQIKDDLLGLFGNEKDIGKSTLTDLQEAKKTILVWYAYHNLDRTGKKAIRHILSKNTVNRQDLKQIKSLIVASGALDYSTGQIRCFIEKAMLLNSSTRMKPQYKKLLEHYCTLILNRTF